MSRLEERIDVHIERKIIQGKTIQHKNCDICNELFETVWSKTKYCSKECKKIAIKSEQRRKYFRRKAKIELDPKTKERYLMQSKDALLSFCDECDVSFKLKPNQVSKFCCEECRHNARKRSARICRKQRRMGTPKVKKESKSISQFPVEHKRFCKVCNSSFKTTGKNGQGGGKYCSDKCKDKAKHLRYISQKDDIITRRIEELEIEKMEQKIGNINPYWLHRGDICKSTRIGSVLSMGA